MSEPGPSANPSQQQGSTTRSEGGVQPGRPRRGGGRPQPDGAQLQGSALPRGVEGVHPKVDAVPKEARPFQGQRAGVVTRTAANTLDFLLVAFVLGCGYAAWCALRFLINPTQFTFPKVSFFVLLVCAGALLFTYFTVTWATTGRTFGDHQMGLRVVNPHGEQLRWPGAVVRAAFCVVLPIGLYWAIFSPTNRSVQDSVLRTSVIYDWTVRTRPPPRLTQQG
jgi:uncharacterized RDD family membrane protein YckC